MVSKIVGLGNLADKLSNFIYVENGVLVPIVQARIDKCMDELEGGRLDIVGLLKRLMVLALVMVSMYEKILQGVLLNNMKSM